MRSRLFLIAASFWRVKNYVSSSYLRYSAYYALIFAAFANSYGSRNGDLKVRSTL